MSSWQKYIALSWIITILLMALASRYFPSAPSQCMTRYAIKYYQTGKPEAIFVEGTMVIHLHRVSGTGTAAFSGTLSRNGVSENTWITHNVNRTASFTYDVEEDSVVTRITGSSAGLNDGISDEESYRYIYSGFRNSSITHGTLMKVNRSEFASGEHLYPKALCSPIE